MKRGIPLMYGLIVWGLILWPFAHFGLTGMLHSNPWKNFGLAMYSTHYRIDVEVALADANGWHSLPPQRVPGALKGGIERYKVRRQARGTLARPDKLGPWALRSAGAGIQGIRFVVKTYQLNGSLGEFELKHSETYEYEALP